MITYEERLQRLNCFNLERRKVGRGEGGDGKNLQNHKGGGLGKGRIP